jgi:hypothetical protein
MAILYTSDRDASLNRYENRVLSVHAHQSYQVMSDIWSTADYALVWDDTENKPQKVCVNIYDMNPSDWKPAKIEVDATEEVRAKYLMWRTKIEYETLLENEEMRVRRIDKGAIAKVVKGKSGKGTIGKVVVVMEGSYRFGWRANTELKVAIATSDVKVKKALRNGKVAEVYQDVVWAWARNVVREDIAEINQHVLWLEAEKRATRYCIAA